MTRAVPLASPSRAPATSSSPVAAPARRPSSSAASGDRATPVLRGVAVGGPRFDAPQDEVKAMAVATFPNVSSDDGILRVFDNAKIERRRFARPLDWYATSRSFADKNAVYVEEALDLSERLAADALAQAGVTPADVDGVVFVSSTGISTPSLDSFLMQRMGINAAAARLPLWGLGCAGGAAGLARAADLVRAGYANVLLVSVEFCSLTFVMDDNSKSNFIGTALFADGGAALVLGPDSLDAETTGTQATGQPPEPAASDAPLMRILSAHSHLIDDSADLTGWDVVEAGFKLRLSPEIPEVLAGALRPAVDASLDELGWSLDDLDHVIVHPGGAKVIDGYELALQLDPHALDDTRTVLREHGNMSSPTVLFVLAETLSHDPRGRGLISATGPGFSAEHLLVEFPA